MDLYLLILYRRIAELVQHLAVNQKIPGSRPGPSALCSFWGVAQLVVAASC